MHDHQMSAEETYVQLCESNKTEALKEVIAALNGVTSTGILNLSSVNLNALTWQSLSKVISSCKEIRSLNFGNCLIPPRGLAALMASLSEGTEVQSLELRGNNIQTTSVTYLGRMLRHNISLKRLSLEWNSLGVFIDTFSVFCDGLGVNQTLETLDLRNNQLSAECAPTLVEALNRNKTLKTLDLRWNNLGVRGGKLLHAVFNINHTLSKVKLQGNSIPLELITAIDQSASHNDARASILQECAARTNVLARQLKKAEEERTRELSVLARQSEEKKQQIIRASEVRVGQMEKALAERDATMQDLQGRLKMAEYELRATMEKNQQLGQMLKEKDMAYLDQQQQYQNEIEELSQRIALKDDKLSELQNELKTRLTAEQKRRLLLETQNLSQAEDISHFEAEILQLKEKLTRARKLHEEALHKEEETHQERISSLEKESEARVNRLHGEMNIMRGSLRHQIQELEHTNEELEKGKAELTVALARERTRREEEVALAGQEARAREICRLTQLEEKLNGLRDEKTSLEKQLAMSHSSVVQLQQQNSSLISELAEPQRKLTQIHEELTNERLLTQRVRQELLDESIRLQSKKKDAEHLQCEMEKLQSQLNDVEKARLELKRELDTERVRVVTLMEQRDREIQNIRRDERERAGDLYSAFNKYFGSLSPSKSKLNS